MAKSEVGLKIVIEGSPKAIKQLVGFQKAVETTNKTIDNTKRAAKKSAGIFDGVSKSAKKSSASFGRFGAAAELLEDSLQAFGNIPGMSQASGQLLNLLGNVVGMTTSAQSLTATMGGGSATAGLAGAFSASAASAVALTAGTAILAAGVLTLGARGAKLQSQMQAFTNTVGDGTSVLGKLRESTRGTVADFELMQLTNVALTGMTSDFKNLLLEENTALGKTGNVLGDIIDTTNRYAAATGQSAEVLREKFLTGLRLGSKLRLDDIVGTIDQTKANEAYAKSNDLVAGSLTEQQEKLALATEAVRRMQEEVSGTVGASAMITEVISRVGVFFQNFIDKLSLLMAPIAEPIFAAFNFILQGIQFFVDSIFQVLAPIISIFMSFLQILWAIIKPILVIVGSPFIAMFAGLNAVLPIGVALLQMMAQAMDWLAGKVQQLSNMLISGLANTVKTLFPFLGSVFDTGTESLASQMGYGAGKIIGSFADGLARGGATVLNVVAQIAKGIADFLVGESPPPRGALSHIDDGGRNTMEAWLSGFQAANLAPVDMVTQEVNDRLGSIGEFSAEQVQARLATLDTALQPFTEKLEIAKADMEAIAGFADPAIKVLERQIEQAISTGSASSEMVQALDRQLMMLKQAKSAEAARTEQAELQLAFKKAEQAQERALLNIQKRRLGTVQKIAGGAATAATPKTAKAAKQPKLGGAGEAPTAGSAGAGGIAAGETNVFTNDAIEKAKADLQAGFQEGFDASGATASIEALGGAASEIQVQAQRIAQSDPAQTLLSKFDGLTSGVQTVMATVRAEFSRGVNYINTKLSEIDFGFITDGISTLISTIAGPILLVGNMFAQLIPQGVRDDIARFFSEENPLVAAFQNGGIFGAGGILDTAMTSLFGEDSPMANAFGDEGLSQLITSTLETIEPILDDIGAGISAVFGLSETSVLGKAWRAMIFIKDAIVGLFQRLFDGASSALGSVADLIKTTMVSPAVNALNSLLQALETAFNDAVDAVWGSLPNWLTSKLGDKPVLTIPPLELPEAARGALNMRGSFIAGERGAELITTRRPATVFPNRATQALQSMAMQPMPLALNSAGTVNNTTNETVNTRNTTFNVGSTQQAILLEQQREARGF